MKNLFTGFIQKVSSKKILLDFFNYYIFTIITALIGIISITYLTNVLTPVEYGYIGIYSSILYFMPALISFSVGSLQSIEIIDSEKDTYIKFRNNYISFLIFNSVFSILIVTIFNSVLKEYSFLVYMALLMGVLLSFTSIHNTELINNSKPTQFGIFSSLTQIMILIFSFVFLITLNLSWKFRIYSFIISEMLIIYLRFFYFSNIIKEFKFVFEKNSVKKMYIYGFPLIFYVLLGWVLNQSDRFFLLKYFSLKEVGIYTVAAGLSSVIVMINTNLDKVLMPYLFKRLNKKEKGNYVNRITIYYSILILLIALLYNITLKYLSPYFLNYKYTQSLDIAYILNYSQAFFGIYTTRGLIFDYYKKNVQKTIIVGICTLFLLISIYSLIPIIGYYSPAVSLLISFLLLVGLITIYSNVLLKKNGII
jgi:O-antigen/teichoic acid export membrane protein